MGKPKTCTNCFCSADSHDEYGCENCRCDYSTFRATGTYKNTKTCMNCPMMKTMPGTGQTVVLIAHDGHKDLGVALTLRYCSMGYWGGMMDGAPQDPPKFLSTQGELCADYDGEDDGACDDCGESPGKYKRNKGLLYMCCP